MVRCPGGHRHRNTGRRADPGGHQRAARSAADGFFRTTTAMSPPTDATSSTSSWSIFAAWTPWARSSWSPRRVWPVSPCLPDEGGSQQHAIIDSPSRQPNAGRIDPCFFRLPAVSRPQCAGRRLFRGAGRRNGLLAVCYCRRAATGPTGPADRTPRFRRLGASAGRRFGPVRRGLPGNPT